ncbi:hypothetical protein [Silvanigrella sp.]|jgi:hypothetical protein|uniref:hypothetical protein n=1 Tax=Silvanigrella sp. TaxID=2024976 RepID=UPI0037C8986C
MRLALDDVSENKYMKELIDILNGGELPFDLPSYINWPSSDKKRAQSERAIKLMLAGVEYFRSKYPLNEVDNKHDEIKITQKNPVKEQSFENPFG